MSEWAGENGTIKGEVASLTVNLGNVEIRPKTPPGGKSTTGYQVLVNGQPVPCRHIRIEGGIDQLWQVELSLLSGTIVGEDGKTRYTTAKSGLGEQDAARLKQDPTVEKGLGTR